MGHGLRPHGRHEFNPFGSVAETRIVQKALESEGLEQFAETVGKALQNYQAPRAQPSSQVVVGQEIADLAFDSVPPKPMPTGYETNRR